jgi:WD40 repeat protein
MALAFSPNGRWLAAGSGVGAIRLWDLDSPEPAARPFVLDRPETYVNELFFSPDGRWLVSDGGPSASLWKMPRPDTNPIVLKGHKQHIESIALSPDGHWLATGSRDGTARLWDLLASDPSAEPRVLPGDPNEYTYVSFSPDSNWLATYGNGAARIWFTKDETSRALTLKEDHSVEEFSADSRWLTTKGSDTIYLWRLRVDELVELGCETAGRNLLSAEWTQFLRDEPYRPTCSNWPSGTE